MGHLLILEKVGSRLSVIWHGFKEVVPYYFASQNYASKNKTWLHASMHHVYLLSSVLGD